ncbi:hypothetical protein BDR07DRAFT_1379005 [Suillus spraguei]|nr:hypothetical protein BDR07DRAFT_1379005 [Suillus spraguei]
MWLLALGLQPDITLMPEDDMAHIRARANTLLDEINLEDYFLNGWDAERSKASGSGETHPSSMTQQREHDLKTLMVHLYCAIRCAATGRLAKTKNILQFSTQEFQPVAIGIRNAIKRYLDCPELNDGKFLTCMTTHHEQCLKALRARTGEASPTKKYKIYVPSSSSELYWPRTSTTSGTSTSALTSNSIPSLVPRNALASSSSASSDALWYPGPRELVDPPQVAQCAPYIPDGSLQRSFSYSESQPHYEEPAKVASNQRDTLPFLQDNSDTRHLYFSSSSSLAGWSGNLEGSSSWRGPLP